MEKNLRKIKYQELFLSDFRNSYFGEKKIEEALREMETRSNMEKLTKALKSIWKQTDEHVKNLESVFPKVEIKEPRSESPVKAEIKINLESQLVKIDNMKMEKRRIDIDDLKNLKVVSYDHLVELVDDLNIDEVTEILTSAAGEEKNNHQYLTKLAEKLLKNRDTQKVPDSNS